MSEMFWGAESFNQPLDNWNVSNVENMSLMFRDATSFNQPLNNWNVSNVRTVACVRCYRRAEVENSGPSVTNETRISRAGLRDSQAFFQCLRGTPFARPDVP